jgi:hypothetical protein
MKTFYFHILAIVLILINKLDLLFHFRENYFQPRNLQKININ